MTVASEAEVRAALAPYQEIIRKVVDDSWAEWRAVEAFRQQSDFGAVGYHRTIANYMFDAMARRATRAFASIDGVHIRPEAQTVKFMAGGDVLFRFKKGDGANLGCNIPTLANLLFIDADAEIPGLPPETAKVEIIWQPNEIWTQVERVLVVARDGDRLLWEYEIDGAGDGAMVIPFPVPVAPAADDVDDVPLIKPKPVSKPETGTDEK